MTLLPTRRGFLRTLTAGASASAVASFLRAERSLAGGIAAASLSGQESSPFDSMRDQYLLDPTVTYLNHASIGTVPRAVHAAGMRYREICEENPWLYIWGGAWEEAQEGVRRASAKVLGCSADQVAITHNTTEGFNLFSHGLPLAEGDEVLFSTLNHGGASICWNHVAPARGLEVRQFEFPLADAPSLSAEDIVEIHAGEIRPNTRVLVFPHIDNIVGLRHPLAEITAMAKSRGVEFVLVDGAQSAGMIQLDLERSGVDGYATSPHKWIQSPKGLGLLFVRRELIERIPPMWVTWGQARWQGTARIYEDYGTRHMPEILALGAALDFQAALGAERKESRYREMFDWMQEASDSSPSLAWRSPRGFDLGASLVGIEVRGRPVAPLSDALYREYGIVLRPFPQPGLNSLRVSPNLMNTRDEILRLVEILEDMST
jgi:selenocysteine lyase/cysteine desulfurase